MTQLRLVKEKCEVANQNEMTLVVAADNREDLITKEAREEVLRLARQEFQFPARGLGGVAQPYPVDNKGEMSAQVLSGKVPVHEFHADYAIKSAAGV